MTTYPSVNKLFLVGAIHAAPTVALQGRSRVTTIGLRTLDDESELVHRVVINEEMLIQPIFDQLSEGRLIQVEGRLDYDDKGAFVSVPARRGFDVQILGGEARPVVKAQPTATLAREPVSTPAASNNGSPAAQRPSESASAAPVATQASQPASRPGPGPSTPGARPGLGGLAAAAAKSNQADDDTGAPDDGGEPDAGPSAAANASAPAAQRSGPPGARPTPPAGGAPRPQPAPSSLANGAARPTPPARPGSSPRPASAGYGGGPSGPSFDRSRVTLPSSSLDDDIPFFWEGYPEIVA
ncbi:MAG: hypothetical protein AB7F74_29280 [Parvibaculaceae bacterium]